jgi:predicted metal-dependent hydrolase
MAKRATAPTHLDLNGRTVPFSVRKVARARRMTLRVDAAADGVGLTLPRWVSIDEGLRFVETKRGWLESRLARLPPRTAIEHDAAVPILGVPHRIRHCADALPFVWQAEGELRVGGPAEAMATRVLAWLRDHARTEIPRRAVEKAARIGLGPPPVGLRDTRSLWGSCSPGGRLSFCWRLVMAPEPILDYVIAHEVAHLRHLNHGKRFWALVETLTDDIDAARAWLNREGPGLHRFG